MLFSRKNITFSSKTQTTLTLTFFDFGHSRTGRSFIKICLGASGFLTRVWLNFCGPRLDNVEVFNVCGVGLGVGSIFVTGFTDSGFSTVGGDAFGRFSSFLFTGDLSFGVETCLSTGFDWGSASGADELFPWMIPGIDSTDDELTAFVFGRVRLNENFWPSESTTAEVLHRKQIGRENVIVNNLN